MLLTLAISAVLAVQTTPAPSPHDLRKVNIDGENKLCIALSPDGKSVAVGLRSGVILHAALPSGQVLAQIRPEPHSDITAVCFSSDGSAVLAAHKNITCEILVWDYKTNEVRDTIPVLGNRLRRLVSPTVNELAVHRGGDNIPVISTLTHTGTGLVGHNGHIEDIDYACKGNVLVSAGSEGQVKLWSLADRKELRSFGEFGLPLNVAIKPDGTRFAVVSFAGLNVRRVSLTDVNAGTRNRLTGHSGEIHELRYLNDRHLLAAASYSRWGRHYIEICCWDDTARRLVYRETIESATPCAVYSLSTVAQISTACLLVSDGTIYLISPKQRQ